MKTFEISLASIGDVKDFVNIVSKYSCDIDLKSGRYIVDAKSIMGIFSLDLTKPITTEVHCDGSAECEALMNDLKRFMI